MSKSPALEGKEIILVLKKFGFTVQRQKGSHVFLKHPDGRATVVPIHKVETIGPGLFVKILRDTERTKAVFSRTAKR